MLHHVAGNDRHRRGRFFRQPGGRAVYRTETPARFMPDTTPAMPAQESEMNGIPSSGSHITTIRFVLKTPPPPSRSFCR